MEDHLTAQNPLFLLFGRCKIQTLISAPWHTCKWGWTHKCCTYTYASHREIITITAGCASVVCQRGFFRLSPILICKKWGGTTATNTHIRGVKMATLQFCVAPLKNCTHVCMHMLMHMFFFSFFFFPPFCRPSRALSFPFHSLQYTQKFIHLLGRVKHVRQIQFPHQLYQAFPRLVLLAGLQLQQLLHLVQLFLNVHGKKMEQKKGNTKRERKKGKRKREKQKAKVKRETRNAKREKP